MLLEVFRMKKIFLIVFFLSSFGSILPALDANIVYDLQVMAVNNCSEEDVVLHENSKNEKILALCRKILLSKKFVIPFVTWITHRAQIINNIPYVPQDVLSITIGDQECKFWENELGIYCARVYQDSTMDLPIRLLAPINKKKLNNPTTHTLVKLLLSVNKDGQCTLNEIVKN